MILDQGIETERLYIVPMNYEFVSKILVDDVTAYKQLKIKPTSEWPSDDIKEIMPFIKNLLVSQLEPDGFGAWVFIDKADKIIIGDGGFKGPPDDNLSIDLGYGIINSRRRQGYAFEAVTALIKWGFSQKNVILITADCVKSNIPSINLLKKVGMSEIRQDSETIYFQLIP